VRHTVSGSTVFPRTHTLALDPLRGLN
jgi:hypothetical protein